MLGDRQSQLQHSVNERLDTVSHRLGESIHKTTQSTPRTCRSSTSGSPSSTSAQKNITALASQVSSLHGVLANKQSRGASSARAAWKSSSADGLPKDCYEFQYTLSNRLRPDLRDLPSRRTGR